MTRQKCDLHSQLQRHCANTAKCMHYHFSSASASLQNEDRERVQQKHNGAPLTAVEASNACKALHRLGACWAEGARTMAVYPKHSAPVVPGPRNGSLPVQRRATRCGGARHERRSVAGDGGRRLVRTLTCRRKEA
ncbi:uncharacterized protein Tco025E_07745 [Trypanosoma conorhini]|uniref:Uncharacterized protein n=1 Tax=Trypanosoma conorhini TaxID=83891 RepID=A0A3R7NF93_9TRYP|nr:uncharacterized protein Tco025E_07745 [Trypanosoma conorhini]RNF05666.1 hypothetical protein Tco025E_07745 [Trypanosoma conorhini]